MVVLAERALVVALWAVALAAWLAKAASEAPERAARHCEDVIKGSKM